MSPIELYDIADRVDHLVDLAYEFGWNRKQLMDEINELAIRFRDEADLLIEQNAKENAQ